MPDPGEAVRGRAPDWWWLVAGVLDVALVAYQARRTFLFQDDYIFLAQGREHPLTPGYLRAGLFQHFSPVSRLIDYVMVRVVPSFAAAPHVGLVALLAVTVAAVFFALRALFGPSAPVLLAAVVVGGSVTLVPLANWWTAGVNILPSVVGSMVLFGSVAHIVRGDGHLRRWTALAVIGYVLAAASYETGILAVPYLALWIVLFRSRLTARSLREVLRAQRLLWAVLFVLFVLALVNYRANYYEAYPWPTPALGLRATLDSLFRALAPAQFGIHGDPGSGLEVAGEVVAAGAITVVVVLVLALRFRVWRGTLFMLLAWLVPAVALILNRVGLNHSPAVVLDVQYYYLSSVLLVIGALEFGREVRASHRAAGPVVPGRGWPVLSAPWSRVGAVIAVVGIGVLSLTSTDPVLANQSITFGQRHYADNLRRSVDRLRAGGQPFTIIDSPVPGNLVMTQFAPFNQLSAVLAVNAPDVRTGTGSGGAYAPRADGSLVPVTLRTQLTVPLARFERSTAAGTFPDAFDSFHRCFRGAAGSSVTIPLPRTVAGSSLAVMLSATTAEPTAVSVSARSDAGRITALTPAERPSPIWSPQDHRLVLRIPAKLSIRTVVLQVAIGGRLCLGGLAIVEVAR